MALRVCEFNGVKYPISYEVVNPKNSNIILFLHGWGSNKELMRQAFGKELSNYRHLYIDMPGFGKSANDNFLRTSDYASIIKIFLEELNITPSIIVGHSFGGKVATLLNPPCLILLSSAGILVPKPLVVRLKIALFKLFKPLGLNRLRELFISEDAKGMNEGMYQTFKATVNEEFEDNFKRVTSKAILFWGNRDSATPSFTGKKIASLIPNSKFFLLNGEHYFFLDKKNASFIADTITKECPKEK